jgi:DNA polymerase
LFNVRCVHILIFIVTPESANPADAQVLREWMRSERRLGVMHLAVEPGSLTPTAGRPRGTASSGSGRPVAAPAPGAAPAKDAAKPPARFPQPSRRAAPGASGDDGLPGQEASRSSAPVSPARLAATPLPVAGSDALTPLCDRDLAVPEAVVELARINEAYIRNCRRCVLHEQRTQTVFGVGNPRPEVVFVGEGPGADEDAKGEPFVGRAGQLLTKMIGAMQLRREDVYICNVVKCRPPENRTPSEDEMKTCSPFLFRQLAILRPRVIVTLGRPATQTLLATNTPIGKLRGEWHTFPPPEYAHLGLPSARLMPTFHPAYLLRSPDEKTKAWSDLQQVMQFLGIPVPKRA